MCNCCRTCTHIEEVNEIEGICDIPESDSELVVMTGRCVFFVFDPYWQQRSQFECN